MATILSIFESCGSFAIFLGKTVRCMVTPPYRFRLIISLAEAIGVQSVGIVVLVAGATGAVFGLQIGGIFAIFKSEGLMGGATGIALATELAPLVTGFLMTGKAGSAIAAELASMVVGEQVDALEAMGVDPVEYLVAPRVIAAMLVMPILCGLFMYVGLLGSFAIGIMIYFVDQGTFLLKLTELVEGRHVFEGLEKMFIFSFFIALIACRSGLSAQKGAKGVGLATNASVVATLLFLLCLDFVISFVRMKWFS